MTLDESKIKWAARVGYSARGIIYLIVGSLAAFAAIGHGGQTTDTRGALVVLLQAPFGRFLLAMVAAGLVGYAVWRSTQALSDADNHGTDARGLVIRAALGISAITHAALAFFALKLVFGTHSGDDGNNGTAWLMSQPYGPWLVGVVGLAVIGAGLAYVVRAWDAKFEERFQMTADEARVITPISQFGLTARGIVVVIIGAFFIIAAVKNDTSEAQGLGEALATLQQQPFGPVLLGVVAIGLIAFGIYSIIETFYRDVQIDQIAEEVEEGSDQPQRQLT